MRVALRIDGQLREVEVDLAGGVVTLEGHRLPFQVVQGSGERVELEIAGEKLVVAGWPEGRSAPLADLSVNGERVAVAGVDRTGATPAAAVVPTPTVPATALPEPAPTTGPGVSVHPPMPGKVVELRVHDGDRVTTGQVLLVVEAMKMRNDIVAPAEGFVRDLRVAPGSNVTPRTAMLRLTAT